MRGCAVRLQRRVAGKARLPELQGLLQHALQQSRSKAVAVLQHIDPPAHSRSRLRAERQPLRRYGAEEPPPDPPLPPGRPQGRQRQAARQLLEIAAAARLLPHGPRRSQQAVRRGEARRHERILRGVLPLPAAQLRLDACDARTVIKRAEVHIALPPGAQRRLEHMGRRGVDPAAPERRQHDGIEGLRIGRAQKPPYLQPPCGGLIGNAPEKGRLAAAGAALDVIHRAALLRQLRGKGGKTPRCARTQKKCCLHQQHLPFSQISMRGGAKMFLPQI